MPIRRLVVGEGAWKALLLENVNAKASTYAPPASRRCVIVGLAGVRVHAGRLYDTTRLPIENGEAEKSECDAGQGAPYVRTYCTNTQVLYSTLRIYGRTTIVRTQALHLNLLSNLSLVP